MSSRVQCLWPFLSGWSNFLIWTSGISKSSFRTSFVTSCRFFGASCKKQDFWLIVCAFCAERWSLSSNLHSVFSNLCFFWKSEILPSFLLIYQYFIYSRTTASRFQRQKFYNVPLPLPLPPINYTLRDKGSSMYISALPETTKISIDEGPEKVVNYICILKHYYSQKIWK